MSALNVPLENRNPRKSVRIGGVWIRSIGGNVELLVELEDGWHLCAKESLDGAFGHIVEPGRILNSPVDYLAVPETRGK